MPPRKPKISGIHAQKPSGRYRYKEVRATRRLLKIEWPLDASNLRPTALRPMYRASRPVYLALREGKTARNVRGVSGAKADVLTQH